MYKPGGGRSPRPGLRGTPPSKAKLVTQKCSFSFIFDRFYSVFIFSPPEIGFRGGTFPPRICSFLRCLQEFLYFPPPKLDSQNSPGGSKPCFTNGFDGFFIFPPPEIGSQWLQNVFLPRFPGLFTFSEGFPV